jgi:drug/metabolite transporter (DMT)-like permease
LIIYLRINKLQLYTDLKTQLFFVKFGLLNFTGGYAFVYWGQQYIASGLGSVLFSVMPFYVLLLSIWMLPQDKITVIKFIGVAIGFLGVVIIFKDQLSISQINSNVLMGMSAVLLAPIFSSLGTIMGKKARAKFHPISLVTFPMLYASLIFYALSFLFEQGLPVRFDFIAVFSLLYLGILGTAVTFVLFFWMLKKSSAVMMSMITFVTPPLALVWGWIILDEPITKFLLAGLICILGGIFLVRR